MHLFIGAVVAYHHFVIPERLFPYALEESFEIYNVFINGDAYGEERHGQFSTWFKNSIKGCTLASKLKYIAASKQPFTIES
jgi:hypothetical protein